MFRSLLATAATVALLSASPAFAADLPMAAPVEPAFVAQTSWTGFYVGIHAGYGFANFNEEGELFSDAEIGPEFDGIVAGGQIGFNYQTGNYVFGIEADAAYADLEDDGDGSDIFDGMSASDIHSEYLATVRGRLGYAFDRIMVFASGGVAFLGYEAGFTDDAGFSSDSDDTLVGYSVGVGIEGFITDNLTARVEYLFNNFSDDQFDVIADLEGIDEDLELHTHVIRGALNYKFSGL